MMKALINQLKGFWAEKEGSVSVEFALAMPFVFWSFGAGYVYFDGFRQSTVNLKAAYTISDLLSRETEVITEEYIDSMYALLQELVRARSTSSLRISVVRWSEGDDRYFVDWSKTRGYGTPLTDATVIDLDTRLPVMPDLERVILVESENLFEPTFNIGMADLALDNFVFSRPRFAPLLVFEGETGSDNPHADGDEADPA